MSVDQHTKRDAGFTLVEVMLSVSIFTIIMTIGIGSLLTINNAHRLSRAQRGAVDSVSFVLDSMAREMYTGYGFSCTSTGDEGEPEDCYNANGSDEIHFTNQDGCQVSLSLNDEGIMRERRGESECATGDGYLTTNPFVEVTDLSFYLLGSSNTNNNHVQPVIVTVINASVGSGSQRQTMSMQTTVTQRALDIADG